MTVADLPFGLHLKDQAGWNQTEADWRRILDLQPEGCFVAQWDGQPVGTTTTCVFDSIGWIGMVLVEKSARGRGIGTRLMEHALAHLNGCGVRTARLDATPLGRPVYEKLGFVAEYELARWEGMAPLQNRGKLPGVKPIATDELEAVIALDRQATGTNRRRLIERLYHERPEAIHTLVADGAVTGYLADRLGSRAVQIGPVVATDAAAGCALCVAALDPYGGQPVFLDVPVVNSPAMQWAESHGLRVQRTLTRMRRGEPVHDHPMQIWAGFGPEKG